MGNGIRFLTKFEQAIYSCRMWSKYAKIASKFRKRKSVKMVHRTLVFLHFHQPCRNDATVFRSTGSIQAVYGGLWWPNHTSIRYPPPIHDANPSVIRKVSLSFFFCEDKKGLFGRFGTVDVWNSKSSLLSERIAKMSPQSCSDASHSQVRAPRARNTLSVPLGHGFGTFGPPRA